MTEPEPPAFDNWKDAWEWHAAQASRAFEAMSEDDLIARVEADQLDVFYSLWDGFRKNGTLARSGPVLVAFLRRTDAPGQHLIRYHAAGALFHLLGYNDEPLPILRKRVQWAHDGEEARQAALDTLEQLVQRRIAADA